MTPNVIWYLLDYSFDKRFLSHDTNLSGDVKREVERLYAGIQG